MSHAIEVEDLVVRYHNRRGQAVEAVTGLSFKVAKGEVVGFLGPNGAGKSSTLKALMGFLQPHSGGCSIFGLTAGGNDAKARCGYLPEVALYYPFLNPIETLTLYGELQGLRGKTLRDEATGLLELVGLGHAVRKQNRTLSKGMLQRVGIAQALLGSPDLLILDEVTSGLDPIGRRELRSILLAKRDQGATLFFSSHELAEVEMLCDRLLIIDKGRLVEERTLSQLKDELRQFEVVFEAKEEPGLNADVRLWDGRWRAVFATKQHLIEGLKRLHEAGAPIMDVISQEGSLEDYFIESVRRAA